ncbi:MAG: polyprenyl synthetase family protein [Verrucomicrobiales bacterium]|nr:polyprenyl synthetase family protein [Verrucomicrobiales bacterium]
MLAEKTNTTTPPDWQALCEPVQPFLDEVTGQLQAEVETFDPQIVTFVQYALGSQGKQLRPLLVALSGRASGGLNAEHARAAVIVEMIHLATLVHDDVVDGAEVRRSRPTLAANWGNKVSVLAGDCLFAEALQLAANMPTQSVCGLVARAAKAVCTGEIRQTLQRGNFQLQQTEYFELVGMKTAELFALACALGARLASAKPAAETALREYGEQLGTAYQIYDDCVDVFGAEAIAGKTLGTDLATGKATLPVLLALENTDDAGRKAWLAMLKDGEAQAEAIRERLVSDDIPAACRDVVTGYISNAKAAVEDLPTGSEPLLALTDCLTHQLDSLDA